jgi:alkanesulfonate monooxygenase SsuD/methylene tetrahydromethanopterin reductase-like flavin-dependent oxidoreductase (luciferase family)
MLRTWVFEFLPELTEQAAAASQQSVPHYIGEYLSLWERDEALGFDGIFFSEHHFGGSFSSSPNLLIAATAARTRTLRLGVMGVVVPYYTAARVVEEIGLLDQLSGGRLEIGTAVGVPQELQKFGLTIEEAREIYNEIMNVLDSALKTGIANYRGKYFNYDNLTLLPRPVQRPHPPKWSTVVNADTAKRAARRNSKICTGFTSTEQVRGVFDSYLAEMDGLGHRADKDFLGLRRRIIVSTSELEASELAKSAADRYKAYVASDSRLKFSHVPDSPQKGGGGGFAVSNDEFISGTPAQVAERIIDQCERTGAGHFLAVLHWGAGLDEVKGAHQLFGEKVIPVLKKAKL